jgi:hypothetical protein
MESVFRCKLANDILSIDLKLSLSDESFKLEAVEGILI